MVPRQYWFVAVAAAALGVGTWFYLQAGRAPVPQINGYVLARPRELPAVELVDEHGAPFRSGDFAGRWSMLFFGYTYCPDICPLTLVALANLKRELGASHSTDRVAYYFVSVDPQRDTPERLREYVAYFDPEFRGLTGSPGALEALAHGTETVFDVPADQGADNYLVSHSASIVLLNPRGEFHAVFTAPHDPGRLAVDFTKVTAHAAAAR